VPVNGPLPGREPAADADASAEALAGDSRAARRLIAVLLLAAAALDLTRCGLVMASAQHRVQADRLVAAGLVAAAVSIWIARACLARRRWPTWAALLIGTASAPQAAVSGFGAPYAIPDAATAALGVLLAVAVLAMVGRIWPGQHADSCCAIDSEAVEDGRCMSDRDAPAVGDDRAVGQRDTGRAIAPSEGGR
jgi:hypothetical protein